MWALVGLIRASVDSNTVRIGMRSLKHTSTTGDIYVASCHISSHRDCEVRNHCHRIPLLQMLLGMLPHHLWRFLLSGAMFASLTSSLSISWSYKVSWGAIFSVKGGKGGKKGGKKGRGQMSKWGGKFICHKKEKGT